MSNASLGFAIQTLGILCVAVAVAYFIKWPKPKADRPGPPRLPLVHIILRWFHSLVWLSFALACFFWASGYSLLASGFALLALIVYLVFLLMLMADRRAG
jgi:hypothetical protein